MGVPLVNVLFASDGKDIIPTAYVTLPLLILHPFQLFVAGLLAPRFRGTTRRACTGAATGGSPDLTPAAWFCAVYRCRGWRPLPPVWSGHRDDATDGATETALELAVVASAGGAARGPDLVAGPGAPHSGNDSADSDVAGSRTSHDAPGPSEASPLALAAAD